MLAKIETLEKQAVLTTTTSVREDIHYAHITKLNTKHTDELSLKLSTYLHLSDLRTKAATGARQEPGSKVEKVAQQVSDSTPSGLKPGVKMGKQRKYLVLAPLAAITASGTQLQQPQPTHELPKPTGPRAQAP
jgi:hypothetical protein